MAYEDDFQGFWDIYPVKRDKLDARKAYEKARKSGAMPAAILAGVDAYKRHKPVWQAFKHAATWLNKGGWQDEWDSPAYDVGAPEEDWFAECQRLHGRRCNGQHGHALQMHIDKHKGMAV